MTLYRINYTGDSKLNRYTEMLIENGQLVEVEKCVHGKYSAHNHWFKRDCEHPDPCDAMEACPGAGLEDTE